MEVLDEETRKLLVDQIMEVRRELADQEEAFKRRKAKNRLEQLMRAANKYKVEIPSDET